MDQSVLKRAQAALDKRQSKLRSRGLSANERLDIDRAAWAEINVLCGGLAPVLVRRHGGDWLAAWIFDRLDKSHRLLVILGDQWRFIRVRESAKIIEVPDTCKEQFRVVCMHQRQFFDAVECLKQEIGK